MDLKLKQNFIEAWEEYFPGAGLPVTLFYSDDPGGIDPEPPADRHVCIIGQLAKARRGEDLAFDVDGAACHGAKRYLGFSQQLMPNFNEFISCGVPGKVEGERYKKTPEIVGAWLENIPQFIAPAKYAIFKRWDKLEAGNDPRVVIFFATPDVLSGLFTLAGYDTAEHDAVIAPFGAGCATIAQYPYLELERDNPRAVLGMFDVSARPSVLANHLTIAVPFPLFKRMVANMDESFLITGSWQQVARRIGKGG